jgi:hypothetical protein
MASPLPQSSVPQSTQALRSQVRSRTVGGIKETTAAALGFKVSKEKLLLIKARAPDYYQVTPTQVEMTIPCSCRVEIMCDIPQVEVTPNVLEFREKCRVLEVLVRTKSVEGLSEVKLIHSVCR